LAGDAKLLGDVSHRAAVIEDATDQKQPSVQGQSGITVRHENLRFVWT
jgi:hypothetical protein